MNKVWTFLYLSILFLMQIGAVCAQDNQVSVLNKVVIDPGHGGIDPGAIGAKSKEKDIVLDISLRLGKMINDKYPDVEVIYTRKTDVFVEFDKRGDIANKAHANLFISIHVNSVNKGSKCPSGVETFVMGNARNAAHMEVAKRENEVVLLEDDYTVRYEGFDPNKIESHFIFSLMQNRYLDQSLDFAAEAQKRFKTVAKRVDRDVKQANFLVLWKTAMPSVLIELGFICNAEEERYLNSTTGKDQLALSIFQAFASYKDKIEARSSFRPASETGNEIKNENPVSTVVKEVKNEIPTTKKVEFCVQIATSSQPKDTHPSNFKKLANVERFQVSANFYKYIVGRTNNYAAAQETLKKVRTDFTDAFLVCIVDGKIVALAEGLKIKNN